VRDDDLVGVTARRELCGDCSWPNVTSQRGQTHWSGLVICRWFISNVWMK